MFVGLAPALTRAGPITRECRQNAPPASSAARLFGNPRSPLLLAGQSRACHRSSSHGLAKGQVVYPCAVCELFVARGNPPIIGSRVVADDALISRIVRSK